MSELLLSARRLSQEKTLQTGKLNVLETLEKHRDLDIVNLERKRFNQELELEWKEVYTPNTPNSYRDLVGKKLSEYKFQYLGRFLVDGKPVEVAAENFSTRLKSDDITNNSVENDGWVNCTWLVDFLMRAKHIQEDETTKEELSLYNKGKHVVLELHRHTLDKRSAEQERFLFTKDLETLTWEHEAAFV
jgi:hypothetical protein